MEHNPHYIPGPPDGPAHCPGPIHETVSARFGWDIRANPPGMEYVDLESDAMFSALSPRALPGAEGSD